MACPAPWVGTFDALVDMMNTSARLQLLAASPQPTGIVQRVATSPRARLSERLACLRPAGAVAQLVDGPLLRVPLVSGRVCSGTSLCGGACSVHILDDVATAEEASVLVAHGRRALPVTQTSSETANRDHHESVGFGYVSSTTRDATHASGHAGHVWTLAMAERLRRLTSDIFGLRLSSLRVAELFVKRLDGSNGAASGHTYHVHCDEAVAGHLHFSSVVWLSEQGSDFEGGELAFYRERLPRMLVEPAIGRAALYTGGWENIHRVKPVTRGERWALATLFEAVEPEEEMGRAAADTARMESHHSSNRTAAFLESCVRPESPAAWEGCLRHWAHIFVDESLTL